jgi:hypothetical protein
MLFSLSVLAICQGQDLNVFAKAHLPSGMELAHPPVAGSFGPPGQHIVVLYRPEGDEAGEFQGTVYLGGKGELPSKLPPLGLIPNQFAIEVKAVFFEKVPGIGSAQPALIILYSYHRNGSETDDSHACAVYQWRDHQFVRLPDTEKKIATLSTAAAVRRRLRQSLPTPDKPATGGPKK